MAVGSKLTKRKGKISKADLAKGRKPSVLTSGWPDVVKLSKEEKFLNKLQDLIDSGIEIEEDDIPDDMLDTWEEFKEDLTPKLVKKNLAFWTAIFAPVIIPGLVKGMRSEPTVPQPKVIIKGRQQEVIPPAKPREIVDYAKKYFEERGLELCKSLTETDLSRLKEDLKANWGKGEKAFSDTFKDSYPVSKSRLETIYRSERHISEYAGVLERAKQANHSYKRWETVGDERTCDVCLAMDGEIVPINEKFSNGQMFPSAHPNCYSSDTEVFTENGWKLFKDVNPYEKIWTLNVDTGSLELDDQVNQISYHFKGNMLHIHNKSFDCLVTPDHNMIVKSGWNYTHNPESPYIYRLAKNIKPGDRIPRTAFNWRGNNPEYIKISERKFDPVKFMTFMGWYVSEGSICKPKGADWQIHISQIKKDNKKEILELCQQLFNKVWECEEYICIPNIGDISEYFLALGHSNEKYIPSEIKNMSKELLSKFMESFIKGDGNTRTNKWIGYNYIFGKEINVSTSSIRLANDLTEVMLKLSRTPSFYIQKPKLTYFKKHPVNHSGLYLPKYDQISIRMNEITHTYYKPSMLEYLPYDGIVYCLEMKNNHSLYIRRNRKATWSGNCRCSMTTYSEENYSDLPDEFIRQDASYLNEVADFMKFNYKCEFNGSDWKCPESIPTNTNKEIKIDNLFEMRNKLSQYINIDEVQKPYNEAAQKLFNKYGSGPDSDWSTEEIKQYEDDYAKIAHLNKIHLDAIKEYNYNGTQINRPTREREKKLAVELKETLDAVTTKRDLVMWRGEYGPDWKELAKAGTGITDKFTSLTQSKEIAEQFKDGKIPYLIRFEMPAGTHAMPTWTELVESPNEREWVLNKGTKLKVIARQDNILNVKVIIDDDNINQNKSYLNDVADFMKFNYKCKIGTYDDTNACGPNNENITKHVPNLELTPKEKSLIAGYTHTSYAKVNYDLRHPNKAFRTEEDKKLVSDTISIMEKVINKSPLQEDMILYRGMGDKFLADNFNHLKGSIIQDNGFISTTTDIDKAGQFAGVGKIETKSPARIVARIVVPKGTNALRIGEYDESSPEKEYVLQHGTKFEVIDTEKTKNTWFVDLKVLPDHQKQNSSYLSEVSDFLKLNKKCKAGTFDDSNKCGPEKEDSTNTNNIFDIEYSNPAETNEIPAGLSIKEKWVGLPPIVKSNVPKLTPEETKLLNNYFNKEKYSYAINKASYNPLSSNKSVIEKGNKLESIINRSTLPIDIVSFSGASDDEINELLTKSTISSFVSTSMNKNETYLFGKNQIEFRLPKGMNALIPGYDLNQFSEDEVLLNRNIKYKIISDKIINSAIEHHYIIVTPDIKQDINSFQEVSSSFNPELGGFHTTDYKSENKDLRIISQDKNDNPKLLDAIQNIDPSQLPSQFMVMKMKEGTLAKYYTKTDSIGVDKNLSSSEMTIEIKKVLDSMKTNSGYLEEVTNFIKLNYRCKKEEQQGEGKGSCIPIKNTSTKLSKEEKSHQAKIKRLQTNIDYLNKHISSLDDTHFLLPRLKKKLEEFNNNMKALKESGPNLASKLPSSENIISIKSVEVYTERMNKIAYNNGTTIYSPPGKEKMLVEATFNAINKMPLSMQSIAKNLNYVYTTKADPTDKDDFSTTAYIDPAKNRATFYGIEGKTSVEYDPVLFEADLIHELSHKIDNGLKYSSSKDYRQVVESDGNTYVTKYATKFANEHKGAKFELVEDFADGVMTYSLEPEKFKKEFPNRYTYFKNIIDKNNNKQNASDFMKLNYKCKREDSPDGSNKCLDTSSNLKSLQSQYKELSSKKEFTSWDEMSETNRKLKELNKKISKEVKKTIGIAPPGFKPNKEGFFTTTNISYGSIRPNPTGEGWISKTAVRSSTGKGPMSGIVEEFHQDKESAIAYIRKELKLPTPQVSQQTTSLYGIQSTENNDINTAIKNADIFHGLSDADFDKLTPDELDEFSKWSADEGIYGKIKKNYDKYMKKLIESGEWRDEEHPSRDELGLNASYLQEVTDFIKLNYRCEFNGTDYKCGISEDADKIVREKIKSKIESVKKTGKGSSKIETKKFGGNFFLGMSDISASEEYQELAKQYGIKDMSTLDSAYELIKGISVGQDILSQYNQGNISREHIYNALNKGGDIKKALELKIAVESQEFFGDHEKERRIIALKKHMQEQLAEVDVYKNETLSTTFKSSHWQDVHDNKFGKISVDLTTPKSREQAKKIMTAYFNKRIKELENAKPEPRTLYRKGGYHENTIESYTTSSEGADMASFTNPGEVVLTPDFSKTSDELLRDGWLVLAGANEGTGYSGESEVVLINIKDILTGNIKRSYDKAKIDNDIKEIKEKNDRRRVQYEDITKKIHEDTVVKTLPKSLNLDSKPINDIEKTKIFKTILDANGKFEKYTRLEKPILTAIGQEVGFDKPPVIVNSNQMDELAARGESILYMGYRDTTKFDQFKTGRYIGDNDDLGTSGYRMFDNLDQAITWGSGNNGFIVRAALDKSAKIAKKDDIGSKTREIIDSYRDKNRKEQYQLYDQADKNKNNKQEYDKLIEQAEKSWKKEATFSDIMNDESVAAITFGYDAIQDSNNKIFALNRGAIYVQQNAVPAAELEKLANAQRRVENSKRMVQIIKESGPKHQDKLASYQEDLDADIAKEKEIQKNVWQSVQQQNASYLNEAATYLILQDAAVKLNANCKDEEKVGSGPGSCSGGNSSKTTDTDIDRGKYYGFKNVVEITSKTVLNHRNSIQQKMEDDVTNLMKKFPNEVASLKLYPAKYKTINNDINNKLPETNDIIKLIDNNIIPENIVVYKGINNKIITDLSKHNNGDIIKLGNGFVSTSLYQDIAEGYADRREPNNRSFVEIHIPKGTNGIYLESLQQDSSPGYHEILLQKNSDYKLLSKETYQQHRMALRYTKYIVEAIPKGIKQNSALLSEAASFIKLNYNCPKEEKSGTGPGSCTNTNTKLLESDKNYFSSSEKTAINEYTQLGYRYINDFLRGKLHDDMPVRAIKIQEHLDSAFKKAFLPESITVYSGLGRSGTDAIKQMKSDLFSYTGYISASKSLDTSAMFASTTEPRILEIKLPKNAPAIDLNEQKISANPEEEEVLINTGTIFKRTGVCTEEHKISFYKNPQKVIIETWQALPRKEIKKIWENDFSGNAIKHYSAYLDEVATFMKLNYRCEFNGTDYKCGISEDAGDFLP